MSNRRAHCRELLGYAAGGLMTPRNVQCLAHPLGGRHVARTSDTLNLAIVGVAKNDLQPLSHGNSINDSYP